MLGEGHPLAEVAVLLAGEVVANSVRHGGSAVAGGVVTVTVIVAGGSVRVEVGERSGGGSPVLRPAACPGEVEGGRGAAAGGRACRSVGLRAGRRPGVDVIRATYAALRRAVQIRRVPARA